MRLFVEVEISPEEVPLATELLKVLRSLTENVKTRDSFKLFITLLARLEDETQLESVASEVDSLLSRVQAGPPADAVFEEFMSAFTTVVFSRQQGVVPFMSLLPRLPEPAQTKIRDTLIPQVLKHLTVRRTIDIDRMDFFAQAEAFASFVNLEFVSITGAISTIITLLKKPENRSAAITMLGKTVELCLPQLTDKCNEATLNELADILRSITEPVFKYDIDYIEQSMGWGHHASDFTMASCGTDATLSRLEAVESYVAHNSTIFAMCYDDDRGKLVSGAKDGTLIVWNKQGQEDGASGGGAKTGSVSPCIIMYQPNANSWQEHGILAKTSCKLVSCIKAMGRGAEHAFVTGETAHASVEGLARLDERVCYYDINRGSFSSLVPVQQYSEHEDLITCVTLYPPDHHVFISGSRDMTIRVWDRRQAQSVGMFGMLAKTGRVQAHSLMITCLDASDTSMVLSAGMDSCVQHWDFRTLSQGGSPPISALQPDESAVLKVAIGGSGPLAATSTLRGLYLLDFSGGSPTVRKAGPFPDWQRRIGRYHDLKWSQQRRVLFAAGDDQRVDVYSLF
eukprot:TRINITY_DN4766_c0_g1_i3.p1 TRINITY_DN4766_c0_g1~~TRINITY_DN4766_c0_g1_i3.p1  ORF type:complete len:567 (+),score=75.98 TRINITY_DN4766_c0_g1_i3:122-1822(+)